MIETFQHYPEKSTKTANTTWDTYKVLLSNFIYTHKYNAISTVPQKRLLKEFHARSISCH